MSIFRDKSNEMKIATFNALNLVLPKHYYYDRKVYTDEEYQEKKNWINRQLLNMQADIVGFQEVFHQEALVDVLRENPFYKGKTQLVVAGADGKHPAVGLISKFPILDYAVIPDLPELLEIDGVEIPIRKFSRPVLKARIKLNDNIDMVVFVAHLKSKRPAFADGADVENPVELAKAQACSLMQRAAEAFGLRTLMMAELQHRTAPVVLMGDFNDTHTAVTTRLLSGEPPFRFLPLDKKLRQWDVLLYHVKDIQARLSYADTYYTHIHNGHHESLDHIMVSQELVAENPQNIGRVGSVRVFNDHLIDSTLSNDRLPVWQSDHAQVVASIEMRQALKRIG
jgi:endonuclease/exonuclease/phosphatase family metal-dependent hydrolase